MVKSQWRKSATWFALNRNHSMVFANEIHLEKGWESVPCCDEHYLPSILAYNNLDSETTCSDGFAHVKWDSPIDSHPHSYRNHEISKESFIQFESQSAEGEGFNHKCSGNPKICHFTARKFNANTKYPLLEKINLMLDDNSTGLVYDGDQWEQFHKKLRIRNINENEIENEVYYLIDGGSLRLIPDMFTLEHMHLNVSLGKVLTQHEMLMFPFGASYPSRKNGQIVKASRMNSIYLIEDGSRREFPTFSTFVSMGYTVSNVTLVTENDLEQIPIGLTLPTL